MSHRTDCPDAWEARREGRRAFERGDASFRNPYGDEPGREGCDEAARSWSSGFRAAEEDREEERAQEQRMEAAARRHAEELAEEDAAYYEEPGE